MTIVAGTADTIEGSLIVAGAVVACDSADLISIAATSEDIGDFVDVYSKVNSERTFTKCCSIKEKLLT
jgi:hypothetical protein